MHMSVTYIVVIVSWVYAYVRNHQIEYIKYIQYFTYQLYLFKAIKNKLKYVYKKNRNKYIELYLDPQTG